jgi:hypothetical protein
MPEQGFSVVSVEIKNNYAASCFWMRELASAGEPVTEPFEFSLYEFVSRFSVSELQWSAASESGFWLVQPGIGFHFVAKNKLGLMLKQLNIIHFLTHLRPIVGGRRYSVSALFCVTAGVYPRLMHALAGLPK